MINQRTVFVPQSPSGTLEVTYQGMSLYMLSSSKQLPTDVTTERSHACVNEQVSL